MGAGCAGGSHSKPAWDPSTPLACGADKDVFIGALGGRPVAVCVAKQAGLSRLKWEHQVLKHVGKHPNIVALLYSCVKSKHAFLAVEAVEPIGFDIDRLVRQYSFARQRVPTLLTKRLINQLASALKLMHSRGILHRDVKVENVLVTESYDAKLIDMGIAIEIGSVEKRWVWSPKSYMAPEVCLGMVPQGPAVDCWGLGLILHQMYQNRWDLLDASNLEVKFRRDRPSLKEPMADDLREAMLYLLRFVPDERWTLANMTEKLACDMSQEASSQRDWRAPVAEKRDTRKWLRRYKDHAPPLSAFAAVVDSKNNRIVGKRVDELDFRSKHGATLLFMDIPADSKNDRQERRLITSPKRDTVVEAGAWLYFGVPPSEGFDEAIESLGECLFPSGNSPKKGRSTDAKAGLMAFSLEFDCFEFPEHIGHNAAIGPTVPPEGGTALDLRNTFGLNIAGIKSAGSSEPIWFPGPNVAVQPGDLGLIVRCPCKDGTTDPTVMDEDLASLLDATRFQERAVVTPTMLECSKDRTTTSTTLECSEERPLTAATLE